jgi:hypothetical protein
MQTQLQRATAYDRYLEVPDIAEWDGDDIKEAIDALESAIINDNAAWDDDGEYHKDFSVDVERIILNEPKEEQLALIKDALNKAVHDYCVATVKRDQSTYCSLYCEV